ncbi:unnamed protein product [Linum trigynum]|uniref:Uncharacterized protein n=1 Tax=Linum trigynum TaxID=586398 RepID=A0AAV2CEG1_9ROSI
MKNRKTFLLESQKPTARVAKEDHGPVGKVIFEYVTEFFKEQGSIVNWISGNSALLTFLSNLATMIAVYSLAFTWSYGRVTFRWNVKTVGRSRNMWRNNEHGLQHNLRLWNYNGHKDAIIQEAKDWSMQKEKGKGKKKRN